MKLCPSGFSYRPPYSLKPNLLTVSRISRDERYKGHFHIADSLHCCSSAGRIARWIVAGTGDDLGHFGAAAILVSAVL